MTRSRHRHAVRDLLIVLAFLSLIAAVLVSSPPAARAQVPDLVQERSVPEVKVQPFLANELVRVASTSPSEVLTLMVHGQTLLDATAAAEAAGMKVSISYPRIAVVVATGTRAQVLAASRDDRVVYLEGNTPIQPSLSTSHIATRADVVHTSFTDSEGLPVDGTGYTIGIVDSGVDGNNPMFMKDGVSKVRRNLENVCTFFSMGDSATTASDCFVQNPANDTDATAAGGHGTHVAGIAAAYPYISASDGAELKGAAPGADLVATSHGGVLLVIGANNGLAWMLENQADPCGDGSCGPIVAVNNSYGPVGGGTFDPNSATALLQREMVEAGIVNVWAAGNDGGDGSESVTNPSGQDPTGGIVSVANYSDGDSGSRDGSLAPSSSRGKEGDVSTYPDISAPGTDITSACGPQLPVCSADPNDPNTGTISGTSMAAPHVAGYVALLKQANSMLSPAAVENLMVNNAHRFTAGDAYDEADTRNPSATRPTSFDKGHGLVDMAAAVASVIGADIPAAVERCGPGSPQVVDAAGDGQDSNFDVIEASLSADASNDVTFTIEVADLTALPPPGSDGVAFYFTFAYEGTTYELIMTRDLTGAEEFRIRIPGGTAGSGSTTVGDVMGSFDNDTDLVTATVPHDFLSSSSVTPADTSPFGNGSQLDGFSVRSARSLVVVVLFDDNASGQCPFIIGATQGVPVVTVKDTEKNEDGGSDPNLNFPLTLSEPAGPGGVRVDVATSDGTATAGEDYTATSATAVFQEGQQLAQVAVPLLSDAEDEPDETLTLTLSNPDGAGLGISVATGTIIDNDDPEGAGGGGDDDGTGGGDDGTGGGDDGTGGGDDGAGGGDDGAGGGDDGTGGDDGAGGTPPTPGSGTGSLPIATLTAGQMVEGDTGVRQMEFTVTLDREHSTDLPVAFHTTSGGTASRDDLTHTSGRVVLPPDQSTASIQVTIIGDVIVEPDETVGVQLDPGPGYRLGRPTAAFGTILDDDAPGQPGELERRGGSSRIDTAVELSRSTFVTSDTVVLARSDAYADALTGGPLAFKESAPLLLTPPEALAEAVIAEITRLGATRVILLGGEAALGPAVVDALEGRDGSGLAIVDHPRFAGADRFDTAGLIAEAIGGNSAYLVEGDNADPARGFPDAVSVTWLAALQGRPVLLATRDALPEGTVAAMGQLGIVDVTIVGGTGAISAEVADMAREVTGNVPTRIAGAERFETSVLVTRQAIADLGDSLDRERLVVATGFAFPDALAAGPVAAANRAMFLLVPGTAETLPPSVRTFLEEYDGTLDHITVSGREGAVSLGIEQQLRTYLRP